ncbi:MAG: complex I NDUFA9 subunit family protein [Planctomycetes bacterium]|nr:complex I NDUFA9 subunit family protein [Planctomycetota bacterium]
MIEYHKGTVLVTGASGFVGRHVIAQLREYQYKIRCLVRNDPEKAMALIPFKCELVNGDICDSSSLKDEYFKNIDAVIHLVGIIQEYRDNTFSRVHAEGTRNIAESAKNNGVKRFIHMSALGTRPNGKSDYHKTKWLGEEAVRNSGLTYTIFRPSIIFGEPPCEFINQMLNLINKPLFTPVAGNGTNLMQPIYVKDVAKLFVDAILNHKSFNKEFNIGGYTQFTFEQIIDTLEISYLGRQKIHLHIPIWMMTIMALMLQNIFERPPITTDQVKMLKEDNICDLSQLLECFNIELRDFESWCRKTIPRWYARVEDEHRVVTQKTKSA